MKIHEERNQSEKMVLCYFTCLNGELVSLEEGLEFISAGGFSHDPFRGLKSGLLCRRGVCFPEEGEWINVAGADALNFI